jgi:adenylyltransferase/sulfurtransferase
MDTDLLRYSCQVALPGFGEAAQQRLQHARVLIVGAGGLGCPSAQYLAAAGVGTLGIADFDTVSVSNLHRQVLYAPTDAGQKKALVACNKLQQQNPGIKLVPHLKRVTSENVNELLNDYDLILDGTDNFETRYLLNDAAAISGKPVVYGAIYQFEGQVAVWNVRNTNGTYSPNYRDLFPEVNAALIPNCADGGVIPTLAGMIGCMQANEAIKLITNTGEVLAGKVLVLDAQTLQSRIIKIGKVTKTNISSLVPTHLIQTLPVADLERILSDEGYELIDVRTEKEHENFNLGGTNIPIDEIEENLFRLTAPTIKVLYCTTGLRSGEAVKIIRKFLPEMETFSLEGGVKAWLDGGF